jgi:ABC-type uncharacterized transport system permease subunit
MIVDVEILLWFLVYAVPVLYAVALVGYVVLFWSESPAARRTARPLLAVAVGANVAYLVGFTFHFHHIPAVTVHQVLAGVGFAVATTYLWVEGRTQTPHTGPFILALVLACQVVGMLNPRLDGGMPAVLDSAVFSLHVTAAILGYSAFALAAVYGLIYLLLYHQIRLKRFGLIFRRLPPLATLDSMNFYSAVVGFSFLSLAVLSGALWAGHVFQGKVLDPKLVVALWTWVLYGAAIFGRRYRSWKGPRLAYSSLFTFVVVVGSMFGVNYALTRFHFFA